MLNFLTQLTERKPCIETGVSLLDMLLPRHDNPIVDELARDLRGGFLLFALVVAIVSVAILIDFVLGLVKSLASGRRIRSFRIRDSFTKMIIYYGSILLLFLIDLIFISHDLYDRPYMAMFAGGGVLITEVLSWFESLEDKERSKIARSAQIMAGAIKDLSNKVDVGKLASYALDGNKPQSIDEYPENLRPGASLRPKPDNQTMQDAPIL